MRRPLVSPARIRALTGVLLVSATSALGAHTLTDIYDLARQHDPEATQLIAKQQVQEARHAQSRAAYLPQVSTRAEFRRQHTEFASELDAHSASVRHYILELRQSLYQPGREETHAQTRIAQAQLADEDESVQQDLMLRYADSYLACLAAGSVERAAHAQWRSLSGQYEAVRRAYDNGTATLIELQEAKSRYEGAHALHEAATSERLMRVEALQIALQQPTLHLPAAADAQVDIEALNAAQIVIRDAKLDDSPQVVLARKALDIARLQISKARAAHGPEIDLGVSYGYTRDSRYTAMGQSPAREKSAQLVVSLPLFTGHLTTARIAEAHALARTAEIEYEAIRSKQRSLLAQSRVRFASAAAQLKWYRDAEHSARDAVTANRFGYDAGVRVTADVLNAEAQLFQMRRERSRALHDLLIAYLTIKRSVGQLARADLARIDQMLATSP